MASSDSSRRRTDLTAVDLKNLAPRDREYEVMDPANPGFGVRVLPSGGLRFMYRYRDRTGKLRRITLQSPDGEALTLATARREYRRQKAIRDDPGQGGDPLELRQQTAAEARIRLEAERAAAEKREYTIADLGADYLKWAARHKKSWRQDERHLDKVILPAWHERPANSITKRDVEALLGGFESADKLRMRNTIRALVLRVWNWGMERDKPGVTEAGNPVTGIKRIKAGDRARKRRFQDKEIRSLLWLLRNGYIAHTPAQILLLCLLTGCRKGEAIEAEWAEIDLEGATWRQPAAKTKNKEEHLVMLPRQAVKLLEAQRETARRRRPSGNEKRGLARYVFPSRDGQGHFHQDATNTALSRALAGLEGLQASGNIPDWVELTDVRPHDMRRIVTSGLAAMGVGIEVRNRITNHVDRSVDGEHYNTYAYDNEAREALQRWADRLDVMTAENVVELRSA